jgi:hypothetical protein
MASTNEGFMKLKICMFFLLLLAINCACEVGTHDLDRSGSGSYFPQDAFSTKRGNNKLIINWYSKHLKAMGEPSLFSTKEPNTEIYRFLWLRSFDPSLAIRIQKSGNSNLLTLKQLNENGGSSNPSNLKLEKTKNITEDEWTTFIHYLYQASFWTGITRSESTKEDGEDGAQWVLEGVKNEKYRVIDQWSPETGDFREACLYLVKLSGLELKPGETY